ncbi:MAG: hypothetical protein NVSMB66_6310 [Candidatus Doudnabacteria bacterium]
MAKEKRKWSIDFDENTEDGKFDDQIFCNQVTKAMSDSNEKKEKNDLIGQKNYKYWRDGSTKEDDALFVQKFAKIVVNRIFTNIETSIPMLTANVPDPTILNVNNTVREKISGMLRDDYEVTHKMQQVIQRMLRNWYIYRIGIIKYRWDYEDDMMKTYAPLPKKVWFDAKCTGLHNCELIIEEMEDSVSELAFRFKKEDELKKYFPKLKGKTKYYEVWGEKGKKVGWCIPDKNLVLGVVDNPNYDYGMDQKIENGVISEQKVEGKNSHTRPKFPYLVTNVFNTGDEMGIYDDTSFIEQCGPILEAVTLIERQLIQLIDGQKRVWAVSSEGMTQEAFQKLVNATGDYGVYYDKGTPNGGISIPMSGALNATVAQHIQHLLHEIDNIMGVHAIVRGEGDTKRETLGGKRAQIQSDISRMDMIVRNIEQVMEDWYLADIQMLKVYATDDRMFEIKQKQVVLTKEEIPDEIKILVKKGSTLPTDDKSRMDMAINLAKIGMIDPHTLFEELSYGKEEERVKNLYQWLVLSGKINPAALQGGQPGGPGGNAPAQSPVAQGQPQGGGGEEESPDQQESAPNANEAKSKQIEQIQKVLADPAFKQLPPERQKAMIEQAKQIISQIQQM